MFLTTYLSEVLRSYVVRGIVTPEHAEKLRKAWRESENWISTAEAADIFGKHQKALTRYTERQDPRVPFAQSGRTLLVHLPSLNVLWDKKS